MKRNAFVPAAALALAALILSCSGTTPPVKESPASNDIAIQIGGKNAAELSVPPSSDTTHPHFISVQVIPGRAMNIFQIRAFIPGKGVVELLSSPELADAAKLLNDVASDPYNSQSFKMGGAILVPFANRITGELSADGKTLQTKILGKPVTLDAN